MGRNHRHKKDLRAEKAKIKLKQSKTKFLPKGQNVTNTSFKIKPIILFEQLKEKHSDDILSKRKLNVKDLLSRIKHYNENVRHSACEELSDLIKDFTEEIIQQHLGAICLAISCLMQDRERKVRKAAVKSIQAILQHVPTEKLIPFFNFFSTNIRCAMTNIDKNIQEDSLLFLNCFIERNCGLIGKSSEKLLPDFLSLISKLRSDSQPGRTLTLNLGSKMTSVMWRIKVLSRLHAVLKVILEEDGTVYESAQDSDKTFDALVNDTFPIYKEGFVAAVEHPNLNIFSSNDHHWSDTVNKHIIALIPLLYETWQEVMPEQKAQKSISEPSMLTEEMASLLTCITNTLHLLWRYVRKIENEEVNLKTVFMSAEGQKFFTHLLKNFPYCCNEERTKMGKNAVSKALEYNRDPRCVHENLLICFLYLALQVKCTQLNLKRDVVTINSYLTKIFLQKSPLSEESVQCVVELLRECFGEHSQKWHKRGVDLKFILEKSITFYTHHQQLSVFQILSNIVNNGHLNRNEKYQAWLTTLPDILCRPSVTDATVSALLDLSRKNCQAFHAALVKKLPEILDNLDELRITVTTDSLLGNEIAANRNLTNIFYYVPSYSEEDLRLFQEFVRKSQSGLAKDLKEMLVLRNKS